MFDFLKKKKESVLLPRVTLAGPTEETKDTANLAEEVLELTEEVEPEPQFLYHVNTYLVLKNGCEPSYIISCNNIKEAKKTYKKEITSLNAAMANNTIFVNDNVTVRGEDISYFLVTEKIEEIGEKK